MIWRSAYQPRAVTPLHDAVGRMIARIGADIAARAEGKSPAEDQVVVIVTDGQVNHSREHARNSIFEMIEKRRSQGRVFVFLGANQDVSAKGGRIAVSAGNRAVWTASPQGTEEMWMDLAVSTRLHRVKRRSERIDDADEFYVKDPKKAPPARKQ